MGSMVLQGPEGGSAMEHLLSIMGIKIKQDDGALDAHTVGTLIVSRRNHEADTIYLMQGQCFLFVQSPSGLFSLERSKKLSDIFHLICQPGDKHQ